MRRKRCSGGNGGSLGCIHLSGVAMRVGDVGTVLGGSTVGRLVLFRRVLFRRDILRRVLFRRVLLGGSCDAATRQTTRQTARQTTLRSASDDPPPAGGSDGVPAHLPAGRRGTFGIVALGSHDSCLLGSSPWAVWLGLRGSFEPPISGEDSSQLDSVGVTVSRSNGHSVAFQVRKPTLQNGTVSRDLHNETDDGREGFLTSCRGFLCTEFSTFRCAALSRGPRHLPDATGALTTTSRFLGATTVPLIRRCRSLHLRVTARREIETSFLRTPWSFIVGSSDVVTILPLSPCLRSIEPDPSAMGWAWRTLRQARARLPTRRARP